MFLFVGTGTAQENPVRAICSKRRGWANDDADCECYGFEYCLNATVGGGAAGACPDAAGTVQKGKTAYDSSCESCACFVRPVCYGGKYDDPFVGDGSKIPACICPIETPYCSRDGISTTSCPLDWRFSSGLGNPSNNGAFPYDTTDTIKCISGAEAEECAVTDLANNMSDGRGDCFCNATQFCSTDGGETNNCPHSLGSGDVSIGFGYDRAMKFDCKDCVCYPNPICPSFAKSLQVNDDKDCECKDEMVCTLDGTSTNCDSSKGIGGGDGKAFTQPEKPFVLTTKFVTPWCVKPDTLQAPQESEAPLTTHCHILVLASWLFMNFAN